MQLLLLIVTPCVGVWIETSQNKTNEASKESHPAWVCGLKLLTLSLRTSCFVTPCVGVWIETDQMAAQFGIKGHTLRGCVD